jgi:hypothetical protein
VLTCGLCVVSVMNHYSSSFLHDAKVRPALLFDLPQTCTPCAHSLFRGRLCVSVALP